MQGYSDPFNRRPYIWGRENTELIAFYRKLGEIRKREKALFLGDMRVVYIVRDILCIERTSGSELICAVVNRSADEYVYSSDMVSEELICGTRASKISIKPMSCALIKAPDDKNEYGVYKTI